MSQVHLVPTTTTVTARGIMWLILKEVVRLHESIVSDRDTKFTSIFWKELHRLMGSKLLMSTTFLSGDDLFSALKPSWSFSNSNLRHLWHSLDSDHLPVLETLWSTSYSEPLPAVPNTTVHPFHSDPLSDTPSKGCSETSTSSKGNLETSSDSAPSNLNSTLTFSRYSWSCSRDRAAPAVSDIEGCVIMVICDIKGRGRSGSVGNARRWLWSWTSIV